MADDPEPAGADQEVAEASGSDSGSDSSSDSDFEELTISAEDTALLMKLEQQLADNPNLYDSHVQYIEVLRRCKLASRLREARQAMHAAFPLTEPLWFDWLSDEIEGLAEAEDIPRVEALMEAAVDDYLSVPLWVQYLEFVRDFDPEVTAGSAEGQARMRVVCERALTAGGLHLGEGARIWGIYRGYEQALLEAQAGEEQEERVRSLWVRQLHVPLADGAATLAAYRDWERGRRGDQGWEPPSALQQAHAKARHAAELRQPYEESVRGGRPADADLLAAYMAYLKVVYERAVAAFPVTHYLWAQYARYLEAHLKISTVVNAVYRRAVRNCPWVGQLWARALRALERSAAPDDQHGELFERGLSAGLQSYEDYLEVCLARVDCLRRRGAEAAEPLRAAFRRCADVLRSYFPDHLDRSFRLTGYWADCEADVCGNVAAGRAVWEAALKGGAGRYADTWAAYIDFERRRSHAREARSLYKRCFSRRLEEGGQAVMCEAWLRFEREEGRQAAADDHLAACLKVEPLLQELTAAATAAADPQQHAVAVSAADKAPQLSREEMRAMRQQADPNFGKRKQAAAAATAAGDMPPPPAKKPRTAQGKQAAEVPAAPAVPAVPAAAAAPAETSAAAAPEQGAGPAVEPPAAAPAAAAQEQPVAQQPPPAASQAQQQEQPAGAEHQRQQQPGQQAAAGAPGWRQQRRTEANTAFVKHLAEGVGEAEVQQLFAECGPLTGIDMGRDKESGRLKGYAYVHFSSPEGLQAACALDRSRFHGKVIMVAPSKPPGQGGQQQQQQPQQGGRGGRDGGRGGRDGGRGRGGLGGGRGRGGRDGGQGRGGGRGPKHRSMVDLGSDQPAAPAGGRPSAPLVGFVPRAAALGKGQQGGGKPGEPQAEGPPKSNAEFRNMFLAKK